MQSGQKSGLPLNMFLPGKSTEWALSSAPSGSPAPGSRSAWPTWSIISSASHGSKAELRLLDMETVHQGTERPAKTGKTSPYGDPSGRPAQVPPCQPKIVTSFEPSNLMLYRAGRMESEAAQCAPWAYLWTVGRRVVGIPQGGRYRISDAASFVRLHLDWPY